MAELLRMPEVSANLESALLSSWTVAEHEPFTAGQVIVVIETDKAVVDYEAESAGTIVRRLVREGNEVEVGAPIAVVAAVGEEVADIDVAIAALGADVAPEVSAEPARTDAVGEVAAVDVVSSASPLSSPAPDSRLPPLPEVASSERQFASPLARKLAREAGLYLAGLRGSGPNGRIVRRDIESAIAAGPAHPAVTVATAAAGQTRDIPHSRLRKAIAARLTESKTTAPHFYVRGSAEVTGLLQMREEINANADVRVSVNDLLIKAIARAHQLVPALNVVWMPDAVRQFTSVDVAVAIATPGGLITPVVRGADRLTVTEVAMVVQDFAERGRAGRLQQHELEGGTVSISNLGMYGTEEFAAIINPPQASILAVGAARPEPVVRDGALAVGTVLRYTLSVDHRPVDGVAAAQWMRVFTELLGQPAKILA